MNQEENTIKEQGSSVVVSNENFSAQTLPTVEPVTSEIFPENSYYKKSFIILGIVFILILVAGIGYYYTASKKSLSQESVSSLQTIKQNKFMDSIVFNESAYRKGFTFPPRDGVDYSSESYEWVTGEETVENWTTLLTTHKMTPLSADKPLSAEVYAQNVVALNEGKGAITMETSLINTPDAVEAGVDLNNPPYIYAYAFPGTEGVSSEVSIQKVINGANGGIEIFIFGRRTGDATNTDAYFRSEQFIKDRLSVIQASPLP